jgi:hypothetical protein
VTTIPIIEPWPLDQSRALSGYCDEAGKVTLYVRLEAEERRTLIDDICTELMRRLESKP